jgi:hypothetical protein
VGPLSYVHGVIRRSDHLLRLCKEDLTLFCQPDVLLSSHEQSHSDLLLKIGNLLAN